MRYVFPKRTILMVGGSGLIGSALYRRFRLEGHTLRLLSTNKKFVEENENAFYWNWKKKEIDKSAFEGVEVIVNLAGANIAGGLWTPSRKRLLYDSRIKGTDFLADTCESLDLQLLNYIGASAMGYYGANNTVFPNREDDPPGKGFLAKVCVDWEKSHSRFEKFTDECVVLRISNVLSVDGGFLEPFFRLSQWGMRIYFSKSLHRVSWIHIDDLVRFMSSCLFMEFTGTFNICTGSSSWYKMQLYMYENFGDQVVKMILPSWLLKLTMGEMSELMTQGAYMSNKKALNVGYAPEYHEFEDAVDAIIDLA